MEPSNLQPLRGNYFLVCEGTCNPTIREYDALVDQMNGGHIEIRAFVVERGRELIHTEHEPVTGVVWNPDGGWCRKWKCRKCGHYRRF